MQKHMPNRKLIFLSFAILTLVAGIFLSVYALTWTTKAGESELDLVESGNKTDPANHFTPTQEIRDLTALVFAVRPTGFDPNEFTVPAGRYLIVVQNRSGLRDLTFRFDRENGERLHEIRQERLNWKRQFDLQPGNYVLSEAEHPEWRAVVRVTPR